MSLPSDRRKYYVVWEGRSTGVFDSWEECRLQTEGYPGARYKAFPSKEIAIEAFRGRPEDHIGVIKSIAAHRAAPQVNIEALPVVHPAIAVDAACSHNPGPVEYQCVDLRTGRQIFHVGPLAGGTNNIGEFLAIVHAMALLVQRERTDIAIYSDSKIGIGWVTRGKANTKVTPSADNAYLRSLICRAEAWLATHPASQRPRLLKWDTDNWGEIPADFGRK
ncbi:MAG: ribonuclease H family protein [Pseudoflavonifractor sp.]|nr:ribonuclease H family protein [Alloprevotella sp.]MCM1117393.1 ribonuclease H family protein [Pseudoflavonifractor sp.]